jgi:hypothetical protein
VRRPWKLGLPAVLGVLIGASIQCGDAAVLPDVCVSDSDCVLDCSGGSCCLTSCPCNTARTRAQAARLEEQERDHCAEKKMECDPPRPDACDWNSRYRPVCRSGSCVAEPIEGAVPTEFRAPEIPARFTAEDPRCRGCELSRRDECVAHVEWQCEDPHKYPCDMAPECDPACCEEIASLEVGLDVAPWGPRIAAAAAAPAPTGVLVFAPWDSEGHHRLGFIEMPERTAVTTDIAISDSKPAATWIDGTSDFLVVTDEAIERASFPSLARRRVLGHAGSVAGLDVAPTGKVALVGLINQQAFSSLATVHLGPDESIAEPIAWASFNDAQPRWSPDGKRIAVAKLRATGRVAVVDASTGRPEGRRTDARFVGPTWHPSGEFLLMWLQDDTAGPTRQCEMVVVTPDRTRHARLGIVQRGPECPAIAVSPDGAHLASSTTTDGSPRLELFVLGSSEAALMDAYGSASVLEWVPLQLAALQLQPTAPPVPPTPEPPVPEPPVPEPPTPKSPTPTPKTPTPRYGPPPTIAAVVAECAAKHPSSETSVTVRWHLAAKTGQVSKVEILSASTPQALARCIESTARELRPRPDSAPSVMTERVEIPKP